MRSIDWGHVLERAAAIVRSYDTSVTLRQLFYRLVSAQLIPNTENAYKGLSRITAKARRAGDFPDLIDRGRTIHRYETFANPADALNKLATWYRLDRTQGQPVSLYLGVEKAGLVVQLQSWFGALGVPVLALGGYASQTYVDDVVDDTQEQEREAVLLYAGDFDPSGEDIDRDFTARTDCWDDVQRIALTAAQVRDFRLPVMPGKASDSRSAGFIAKHGALAQVELDALDPNALRGLVQTAIDAYWDTSRYEAVVAREVRERATLQTLARQRRRTQP
ncbi:MAG: hypothetical protein GEU73_08035 [Chloroflexi bacterium]|nr:hypothetical protein [Chloroflexota bacterium]